MTTKPVQELSKEYLKQEPANLIYFVANNEIYGVLIQDKKPSELKKYMIGDLGALTATEAHQISDPDRIENITAVDIFNDEKTLNILIAMIGKMPNQKGTLISKDLGSYTLPCDQKGNPREGYDWDTRFFRW